MSETRAIILDDQYQPDRDIATVFRTNTDTSIVESARPAVLEIGERLAVLILREGS